VFNRRWWDAAVTAAVVVVVVMTFGLGQGDPLGLVIGSLATMTMALGYLLVARPGFRDPRAWRSPVYAVLAAAALAAGCASEPFFAIMQAIAYPLVWVLTARRRVAIAGSIVIAAGVFIGFALFSGIAEDAEAVPGALAGAAATAGFSLAFAVALGLWISGIVEYGEERARLVAELTAAQAQVEALSRDRGASEERERLAREIHDTLAQTLAGLVLLAERAGRQSRDGHAQPAAETIATVEQVARDALAEARALVARTAAVPAEPAFEAAVERLVERFRAQGGPAIDLEVGPIDGQLERDAQVVLLRCLQEALSNVAKHAGATHVIACVAVAADGAARLEVTDDGRGFAAGATTPGFGLDGMSERVALAGGVLTVTSSPGSGTILRVDVPSAHEREDA
jgi:signal transduction histidine kinase